jgi:hypothetical protein
MGGEPDQEGAELAALAVAERPEHLALGAPRSLAGSLHGAPSPPRQLDAVTAPVRRIRQAGQKTPLLELVEQGHQVARLDPKRERQLALGDRPLRVEVVENCELGPPQPAVAEAAAEPPGGGAG